jgi:hypothetical protein
MFYLKIIHFERKIRRNCYKPFDTQTFIRVSRYIKKIHKVKLISKCLIVFNPPKKSRLKITQSFVLQL